MDEIIGTSLADNLIGGPEDNIIIGGLGNDSIFGGAGNDSIEGGFGDDILYGGVEEGNPTSLYSVGGRDTLEGGAGNDAYGVSLTKSGGTVITDEEGTDNVVLIIAENTDLNALISLSDPTLTEEEATNIITEANNIGDSFVEVSLPQQGIVGLGKSGTDLIIDINRDGVAETENDLTITNYFDEQGNIGAGAPRLINNLLNREQEIADLFMDQSISDVAGDSAGNTVYRFFNNSTGVHFYTADENERDAVQEIDDFSFDGDSYKGVDPLSGASEPLPVYRFLNENTGVHLYTISEAEKNVVQELNNFSFEGEVFFAYDTQVEGTIPIYRFFNSTTGAHFYTPSASERDFVADNLSDFQSEDIAYYALPTE